MDDPRADVQAVTCDIGNRSGRVGNLVYVTVRYSEKTAELIDAEVKRIIDEAYKMARKVLTENSEGFTKLAELLLEKEVIFAEDLESIFGKRSGKQPLA